MIIMWLLSQGDKVEFIRPEKLRKEMKSTLLKILE
ncbi:MAG: WYL domain-containing protein [Lachnospiraceae bacterium]|nr:WYL domain-containing protein [Lachnospiraceae bacterium]